LETVINKVYQAFNDRDVEEVLSLFHPSVDWPNSWEGGYLHGRDAVRDYWFRQWKELDPVVKPVSFRQLPDGKLEVGVHQLVKNLKEEVISDSVIKHTYAFEMNLIKKMEIGS
jgi:hypothetical protein